MGFCAGQFVLDKAFRFKVLAQEGGCMTYHRGVFTYPPMYANTASSSKQQTTPSAKGSK